jgi:hypothetical protein
MQRPDYFQLNIACGKYYSRMELPRWAEAAHYGPIAVALRPEPGNGRSRVEPLELSQHEAFEPGAAAPGSGAGQAATPQKRQ